MRRLFVFLLFLVATEPFHAQVLCTACKGGQAFSSVRGRGQPLFFTRVGISLYSDLRNRLFVQNREVPNYATWNSKTEILRITVQYPLAPEWVLLGAFPYKRAQSQMVLGGETLGFSSQGLGDLTLGIKRIFSLSQAFLSPILTLQIPTGKYRIKQGDTYLPPTMSPGMGTWGFSPGLTFSLAFSYGVLSGESQASLFLPNKPFSIGPSVSLLVDYLLFFSSAAMGIGLHAIHHAKDTFNGVALQGTQYTEVRGRAIFGWSLWSRFSLDLQYEWLTFNRYDGNQLAPSRILQITMEVNL